MEKVDNKTIANLIKNIGDESILVVQDGTTLLYRILDIRNYTTEEDFNNYIDDKTKAMKKMKNIDDEIGFYNLLSVHGIEDDMSLYTQTPEIAKAISTNVKVKINRKFQNADNRQLKDILSRRKKINIPKDEYIPYFVDELSDKVEYIDWDKFLLLSAYKAKNIMSHMGDSLEEQHQKQKLENLILAIPRLIDNLNTKISELGYSFKDLKQDIKNMTYGSQAKDDIGKEKTKNKNDIQSDSEIYTKIATFIELDPNYNYFFTKDGYIVFSGLNQGKVAIERLLKKTQKGYKKAMDSATYIMNIDEFETFGIITEDNNIDLNKLSELQKVGKADKYIHNKKWKNRLFEAFGIHSEKQELRTIQRKQQEEEISAIVEKMAETLR